jgi:hypothetical protein
MYAIACPILQNILRCIVCGSCHDGVQCSASRNSKRSPFGFQIHCVSSLNDPGTYRRRTERRLSTADVAKILLESAQKDRLDFRMEVAELQQSPTESLWAIRRKWEQKQDLSRAEWVLLSQYIQVACEELSENSAMPSPRTFAVLLEALLAVRGLRVDRGVELDRYYLGNLKTESEVPFNDRQLDPDLVPRVVGQLVKELVELRCKQKPSFAGRNFYVAIRDEELPDIVALNRVLSPHMTTLFRLAGRGHWIRERRPVRSLRESPLVCDEVSPVDAPGFRLSFAVSSAGEVSILISMDEKDLMYPLGPYPEIQEFLAMLEHFKPEHVWNGICFHAYAVQKTPEKPLRLYVRRRGTVTIGFSSEDWQCLKDLFVKALAMPHLQQLLAELSLVYGEL